MFLRLEAVRSSGEVEFVDGRGRGVNSPRCLGAVQDDATLDAPLRRATDVVNKGRRRTGQDKHIHSSGPATGTQRARLTESFSHD
ncbi:uncharacterized protein ColSpa_06198 [Colletotrichum spaethianum]|uniref:Uncharacterized protein n=1 Tax=Colletotrichum spaethianum TaxID=700344 RepID=A0AA37LKJ9_9PEZI|nr:uncharacterized protein ColSpa_06198 [Colletotrichum spaethianum]GKT46017.1 hypothetical protein ColSpa_06198 [Colletotrichum spaethianum]